MFYTHKHPQENMFKEVNEKRFRNFSLFFVFSIEYIWCLCWLYLHFFSIDLALNISCSEYLRLTLFSFCSFRSLFGSNSFLLYSAPDVYMKIHRVPTKYYGCKKLPTQIRFHPYQNMYNEVRFLNNLTSD